MPTQFPTRRGSSKIVIGTDTPGQCMLDDSGDTSVLDYGPIPNFKSDRVRNARLSHMRSFFALLRYHEIPTHLIYMAGWPELLVREVRIQDQPLLSPPALNTPRQVGLEVLIRTRISKKTQERIERGEIDVSTLVLAEGETLTTDAILAVPYVEFSAKWIKGDPYLSDKEAMEIGELDPVKLQELKEFGVRIGKIVDNFLHNCGYLLVDFKIEVAIDPETNGFIMIDALTLDEMGLIYRAEQYGKNPLRRYYQDNHPNWVAAFKQAVKAGLPKSQWPKMPLLPLRERKAHENRYLWAAQDFEKAVVEF